MQVKLPSRKSKVERLFDKVRNPQKLTVANPTEKAGKQTLVIAASVAGIAAVNAGVSSLRKRSSSTS